jgi:phenylalanyl-tRNA synthetase alpha chain
MTHQSTLRADEVRRALELRDLTDPAGGAHAMQHLLDEIEEALTDRWDALTSRHRANPVVAVTENYDRLLYPPSAAARDARYSRYLTDELMLRTHTSAMIPRALERIAADSDVDVVVICPGLVYRRDVIDRRHVGEPHQLDIWRVRRTGRALDVDDLVELVDLVVGSALPGRRWREIPARHPYTLDGRQIDVETDDGWVEIGECGRAHPDVLAGAGLDSATGLASGWGLDRLLMIRKGIDDIRLLRSPDPRVTGQMGDLEPYVPVSAMPAATRDLSVAVAADVDDELLGDAIRAALGADAGVVEDVCVMTRTSGEELPMAARARLGMRADQDNLLIRIALRDLTRTLTSDEANRIRDRIYAAIHEGDVHTWASDVSPATRREGQDGSV